MSRGLGAGQEGVRAGLGPATDDQATCVATLPILKNLSVGKCIDAQEYYYKTWVPTHHMHVKITKSKRLMFI
jgi:hypothetical protein